MYKSAFIVNILLYKSVNGQTSANSGLYNKTFTAVIFAVYRNELECQAMSVTSTLV